MSENAKQNGGDVEVKPSTSLRYTSKEIITVKGESSFVMSLLKILKYILKYLLSYNF